MKLKHLFIPLSALALTLSIIGQANAFSLSSIFSSGESANNQTLSAEQVKQVETIISNYFVAHPKDLMKAFHALQKHQIAEQQKKTETRITQQAEKIFSASDSPVMGNPNGNVTLVEFLDYRCRHCKDMGATVKKLIDSDTNIRVVIKELPIFGGESEYAAKAALASVKQGKFRALHEALLATKLPLNKKQIMKISKRVGLNLKQLQKDMTAQSITEQIEGNIKLARSLAIAGTPAFIIGDRQGKQVIYIGGALSLETLQQKIAGVRKAIAEQKKG